MECCQVSSTTYQKTDKLVSLRANEKANLESTNNQLAHYVDYVRSIRDCNAQLEQEHKLFSESISKRNKAIESIYTCEISLAEQAINQTIKEKDKSFSEIKESETQIISLTEKFALFNKRRFETKMRLLKAESELSLAERYFSYSTSELEEVKMELEGLRNSVSKLNTSLTEEILARDEELCYADKSKDSAIMLQMQLTEALEKQFLKRNDIEEHSFCRMDRLSRKASNEVSRELDELRTNAENEAEFHRITVDSTYNDNLQNLEQDTMNKKLLMENIDSDVQLLRSELSENNKKLKNKRSKQLKLEKEIQDLTIILEEQRLANSNEIMDTLNQTKKKKDSLSSRLLELQKLLEQKVALGREIDTYKMLIEEEENRLSISSVKKRKHTFVRKNESSSDNSEPKRICSSHSLSAQPKLSPLQSLSPIQTESDTSPKTPLFVPDLSDSALHISIVDTNGRYIQIKNKSNSSQSLEGFTIHHSSRITTQSYVFPHNTLIAAGANLRVWCNTSSAIDSPPTDVVWVGQEKWVLASVTKTLLLNPDNEKVSVFTQRMKSSEGGDLECISPVSLPDLGETENRPQEACSIM